MIGIKIRKSDDAVINIIEISCADECYFCEKNSYCYAVDRPDDFELVPAFTTNKWVYILETDSFLDTELPMDWE
jgi:hypothetical protein